MDEPSVSRILIAEDSRVQRQLIRRVCEELPGVTVYEAANGAWAMQQVRLLGEIDLVISDLNMPGMDGVELLQRLSTHPYVPALILVSGYAPQLLENCKRAAEELGIAHIAHLSKPLDTDLLLKTASELLQRRKAPSTALAEDESPLPLIDIIKGLAHNEFRPYFQPIFELASGRLVQCEVLARWQHPELGVLSPARFINRLDSDGHLTLLTRRMAQSAFDLLQRDVAKSRLRLSLNLSRSQLEDRELLDWLEEQLQMRGLRTSQIVLEITETSAFANLGKTLTTLLHLRLRGFELSLDDFGTGHTALEHLRDLPITELKFDRSLIKDIHQNARCQSIIHGMVRIADELGLRMVAEGIDDEADLAYLREHHSHLDVQGFLLGKPMSAQDFSRRAHQHFSRFG
ncbi:EAL domain-containing response regulator [Chitinibacteraceae bacterium HSL-7]